MTPREDYLRALFTVSKTTPPEVWTAFVNALTNYTWDQMERVITSAPTNDALIAIGMVRHMRELRDEIVNIEAIVRKMMDKEKK